MMTDDFPDTPRHRRITYEAPIRDGYEMTAAHAPAVIEGDKGWRVVAIPGTPSRPHMFIRLMRLAPPDLEVYGVNRAGYGGPRWGSGRRAPVLSFDEQVAAIAPLFDREDGRRTIVVGVSYGGALALKCALDFPERVAGVVTVAALVTEPRKYILDLLPLAEAPGLRQALPGYLHTARAEVAARRAQVGEVFSRLKELAVPATVMHGDLDTLVAQADAEALLSHFGPRADVDYMAIPGGTHYLELLNPRTVYRAIRSVIARAEAIPHKDRDVKESA